VNLLSIDPGYSARAGRMTGLALFVDGKLLKFGYLKAAEVLDPQIRLGWLDKANHLAIEAQHFQRNVKTLIGLVEAKCRWTVLAEEMGLHIVELAPSAWIAACQRGWRRGSKKDLAAIESYIRLRWGIKDFIQADALAAIALGTCALDRMKRGLHEAETSRARRG
jgi:hypothetical protein